MEGGGTFISDLPSGGYGGGVGGPSMPTVYNPAPPPPPPIQAQRQYRPKKSVTFSGEDENPEPEDGMLSFISNPRKLKATLAVIVIIYVMFQNATHLFLARYLPNMLAPESGRATHFSIIMKAIVGGLLFFFLHNIMQIV